MASSSCREFSKQLLWGLEYLVEKEKNRAKVIDLIVEEHNLTGQGNGVRWSRWAAFGISHDPFIRNAVKLHRALLVESLYLLEEPEMKPGMFALKHEKHHFGCVLNLFHIVSLSS